MTIPPSNPHREDPVVEKTPSNGGRPAELALCGLAELSQGHAGTASFWPRSPGLQDLFFLRGAATDDINLFLKPIFVIKLGRDQ